VLDEPRKVIPTDRELRLGATPADPADPASGRDSRNMLRASRPKERESIAERLRAFATNLDPRTFGSPYGARPLVLLLLLTIAGGLDNGVFLTLGPEIRREFHVTLAQLASVAAAVEVARSFLGPALGYISDRVHRIRMLTIGMVVSHALSMLSSFAPSFGVLQSTRMSSALASSVYEPVLFPLVADWYPQESRVRAFGLMGIAGRATAVVSPVILGGIGLIAGWRTAAFVLAAVGMVLSFGFLLLPNPPRGYLDRKTAGVDDETARDEPAPMSWSEAWRAAGSVVTVRRIWYATPLLGAGGTALALLLSNFYAQNLGLNSFARGAIVALNSLTGIIALSFFGSAADRLVHSRPSVIMTLFAVANAAIVAPIIVLVLFPVVPVAIVAGIFVGALQALLGPALAALLSLVIGSRLRGLGLQTFKPWAILGQVLSVPAVALGDSLGLAPAIIICSLLFIAGSIILGSAASGVQGDIRAALAATAADEEARRAKAAARTKVLIIRDLDVAYDAAQVLFNVDLDIAEGELVALVGTNGAGKSTLLRAIAGVQEASNGAIFLDGRDITHRPPSENAADGVVFVPGGRAIFPTLTVADNIRTAGFLRRDEPAWIAEKTEEIYALFPVLRERASELAGNLSGGEQQMLAIGQAFLLQPKLLMIDELSLGLAPAIVERLLDVVRAINAQGTTIVLVEQSLNIALTIAKRAVFLDKGRVQFDGPVDELLGRGDLVRAVFLAGGGGSASPARARRRPARDGEADRVLDAADIHVQFGGVRALDGAGVTVDAGQIVGIIGPNGAGKTTLFDVISGFVKPIEGRVAIGGVDALPLRPDARARLGLARSFQNARLFPSMTVRENIAVALETQLAVRSTVLSAIWAPAVRRSERRIRRRVEYLIGLFGLEPFADKFVSELSTGTRRIVDIACITATEPKLLLLDEPSSGLAQAETEALGPVVRRLARDTGCGVLVIEHDLPLITSLADRLLAMELGRPIMEGLPEDVVSHPTVVEAYLGADPAVIERSGPLTAALQSAGLVTSTTEKDH
jgi:ABC-type branched-subunit amino acid transport system ATPase component/predicted MFS family arabinose efflux permease